MADIHRQNYLLLPRIEIFFQRSGNSQRLAHGATSGNVAPEDRILAQNIFRTSLLIALHHVALQLQVSDDECIPDGRVAGNRPGTSKVLRVSFAVYLLSHTFEGCFLQIVHQPLLAEHIQLDAVADVQRVVDQQFVVSGTSIQPENEDLDRFWILFRKDQAGSACLDELAFESSFEIVGAFAKQCLVYGDFDLLGPYNESHGAGTDTFEDLPVCLFSTSCGLGTVRCRTCHI